MKKFFCGMMAGALYGVISFAAIVLIMLAYSLLAKYLPAWAAAATSALVAGAVLGGILGAADQ